MEKTESSFSVIQNNSRHLHKRRSHTLKNINIKIPIAIHNLALQFKANGFPLYIVGGMVRDFCMRNIGNYTKNNIISNDFDFCTPALPSEIKVILQSCKSTTTIYDIGQKYGTIGVMFDGILCEITTFRSEGEYKDNRHPKFVAFERDISVDLGRRDFTINAMAFDILESQIIDIFGGMVDLKAREIRAVGNANQRFAEDGLRILRAFSFVAKLGFNIENTTMSAIIANKYLLVNIAKERIGMEITKILQGKFAFKALKLMQKNDIFSMNILKGFSAIPKNARIYSIFLIFKDKNLLEPLQNKRTKNIEKIFNMLDSVVKIRAICDIKRIFAYLRIHFELGDIQIALSLKIATCKQNRRLKKGFIPKLLKSKLKINGFDLQNLGFKDTQIGVVKMQLLHEIYSGNLQNNRAILLRKIYELIESKSDSFERKMKI